MDARRLIARVPHFRFRASAYWPTSRMGRGGLIKEGFVKDAWRWVCVTLISRVIILKFETRVVRVMKYRG